jgi:hypothetical protein
MMDIDGLIERTDTELSLENLMDGMTSVYRAGAPPVTIQQYLEDPYYMGKVARDLYPDNVPDVLDIFHPNNNYIEVILTGATSIGKTFMAALCMSYIIYNMGCFTNPHRWLGASPASPIVLINMSVNAQKAREVIFTRVKTMCDMSPYFREQFPRDMRLVDSLVWRTSTDREDVKARTGAQIMFKPGTGDSLSALGDDIYAGIGDELNFFRVIEKSKRSYGEAFDPAQRLYDVISRRMKGRFSAGGLALGKFFLLSSAQYPDDFIERRIAEAEEAGDLGNTVKVIRKSIWQAKRSVFINGAPVFSDKKFRVEVGTTRRGSRLLDVYDKRTQQLTGRGLTDVEGKVLAVPVELWDDFYRDIEGAVRDFGGEVTRAIAPFFNDTDVIYAATTAEPALVHPWTVEETTLEDGSALVKEALFAYDEKEKRWRLKRHSGKLRYAHVDSSESGDSTGVAVVHVGGWKREIKAGKEYDEPVIEPDLVLRINPPRGGEIRFARVREIFYALRNYGMSFGGITYDSFQSTDSIQELTARGFRAEKLSVDRDVAPYNYLKDCFFDRRLQMYYYEHLITELSRLERKTSKIDHPANGSKDVADALAGAVWGCYINSSKLSDSDAAARMPKVGPHQNPMVDQRKEQMKRERASMEEELRTMMGGSRMVRR